MAARKKKKNVDLFIDLAIEAVQDKKAIQPVILDFSTLNGSICDAFLICHGTSRVHVEAIADHVIALIKKKTGVNPSFVEGVENAEWVLIDYFDLVVHVFQDSKRKFFNLEQLWADARIISVAEPAGVV
jgi:ribosome-associated protein